MPRMKTLKIAALNITIHPHKPELYVNLIRDVFKSRKPARFRSNHFGMIGTFHYLEEDDPLSGIHGELHKFLDFDMEEEWLNLNAHKKADKDDLEEVNIPEHLKPDFSSARYVFYPRRHRLFFESFTADRKSFGPQTVERIFAGLFNNVTIKRKYGPVDVTVEPTREGLEKIFEIPKLRRLKIILTKPNADDQDEEETKVLERLDNQNARRMETTLVGESGMTLAPDEDTRVLASVAASNGRVFGEGKDIEGKPVSESTEDHPWQDVVRYNPKSQGPREAFLSRVADVARNFRARLR